MAAGVLRRTVLQGITLGAAGSQLPLRTEVISGTPPPGIVARNRIAGVGSLRAATAVPTGTIVVGGTVNPFIALLSSGNIKSRTTLELPGTHAIFDVTPTSDGGMLLGGRVSDDATHAVAYKLDAERNVEWWTRHRDQSYISIFDASVAEFEQGVYALAWSEQRVEMKPTSHLVALDADGHERWRQHREVMDAYSASDGIVVSGQSIEKIRADGSVAWSIEDNSMSLAPTPDGGFATSTEPLAEKIQLKRYDSKQNLHWTKQYEVETSLDWQWRDEEGSDLSEFALRDIATTPDGGFVLLGRGFETGKMDRRIAYLLKADSSGTVAWKAAYPIPNVDVQPNVVHAPAPGRYIVAGHVVPESDGGRSGWFAVLDESVSRQLTPIGTRTTTSTASPNSEKSVTTDGTTTFDGTGSVDTTVPGLDVAAGIAGILGGAILAVARFARRE